MHFEHKIWSIEELNNVYRKKKLDLSPPYQRNPIWSSKAQRMLINTIRRGQPIPNFFLLLKPKAKYEMVDGQQRARTIFGFLKGVIPDLEDNFYQGERSFLRYELSVTIISRLAKDEAIEEFYALVNSAGLRLNRPELMKARYYDTRFLELINSLAALQEFSELALFSDASTDRRNDIEFVSELVALLKFGISEKKDKVDELYEKDINNAECAKLTVSFRKVLAHFLRFNAITPINQTRYKQKNDFYSVFGFIARTLKDLDQDTLDYHYRILVVIGEYISPSQEECPPFLEYAINCVTQSNSKKAREERDRFLSELFLNSRNRPNNTQSAILDFFEMADSSLVKKSGYFTIDLENIPERDAGGD